MIRNNLWAEVRFKPGVPSTKVPLAHLVLVTNLLSNRAWKLQWVLGGHVGFPGNELTGTLYSPKQTSLLKVHC